MEKQSLNEKLEIIRNWLGTGSLNIFGLPMSGKDTVGMRLAEDLQARFLSSGIIIRAYEAEQNEDMTGSGKLIPTNTFYDIILPYFSREELRNDTLVLSSYIFRSGLFCICCVFFVTFDHLFSVPCKDSNVEC